MYTCKYCNKVFDRGLQLGGHVVSCNDNPNARETRYKMGSTYRGKSISDESKEKTSNSMKIAHAEGRAWNIGKSRWNNEPSYPEIFFMKVIENEFIDKNFTREYPIGIYSIDFAWIDKKLAIEIDGEQHSRYPEYNERDRRKDVVIKDNGWEVLRVEWRDLYTETKKYISICKDFIHR